MAKNKGNLNLGNSLIIENVRKLKNDFDKALAATDTISLESGEINQIDLAGVQLLSYFIVRARSEKKTINFKMSLIEEQKVLLARNGFSDLIQTVFV